MKRNRKDYCFCLILMSIIIIVISLQSANARVIYWGWTYNISANHSNPVNLTYNYSTLEYHGYIKNEDNIDVFNYNLNSEKFSATNSTQNKTAKTLVFQDQGFPKYYRLGEYVPYVIANLSMDYLSTVATSSDYIISYILSMQPIGKASSSNYTIYLK